MGKQQANSGGRKKEREEVEKSQADIAILTLEKIKRDRPWGLGVCGESLKTVDETEGEISSPRNPLLAEPYSLQES